MHTRMFRRLLLVAFPAVGLVFLLGYLSNAISSPIVEKSIKGNIHELVPGSKAKKMVWLDPVLISCERVKAVSADEYERELVGPKETYLASREGAYYLYALNEGNLLYQHRWNAFRHFYQKSICWPRPKRLSADFIWAYVLTREKAFPFIITVYYGVDRRFEWSEEFKAAFRSGPYWCATGDNEPSFFHPAFQGKRTYFCIFGIQVAVLYQDGYWSQSW